MGDHAVVVEAPLDEARSLAVIAKVKETIPGSWARINPISRIRSATRSKDDELNRIIIR